MRRLIFVSMFVAAGLLLTNRSQAQLSISVNLGSQPAWAPEGYDETPYYYIPDMDIYYDVPAHQFVYFSNRRWVRSAVLPPAYQRFDLYRVHKVAINQRDAYKYHDRDRRQYAQYRGKYDQHPIRDSREEKYTHNRDNWDNNRFRGHDDNGRGKDDNRKKGDDHHDRGH